MPPSVVLRARLLRIGKIRLPNPSTHKDAKHGFRKGIVARLTTSSKDSITASAVRLTAKSVEFPSRSGDAVLRLGNSSA